MKFDNFLLLTIKKQNKLMENKVRTRNAEMRDVSHESS